MNRAVGRGPEEEGPLAFFKIGCGGGGLDALEDRFLTEASPDLASDND